MTDDSSSKYLKIVQAGWILLKDQNILVLSVYICRVRNKKIYFNLKRKQFSEYNHRW